MTVLLAARAKLGTRSRSTPTDTRSALQAATNNNSNAWRSQDHVLICLGDVLGGRNKTCRSRSEHVVAVRARRGWTSRFGTRALSSICFFRRGRRSFLFLFVSLSFFFLEGKKRHRKGVALQAPHEQRQLDGRL